MTHLRSGGRRAALLGLAALFALPLALGWAPGPAFGDDEPEDEAPASPAVEEASLPWVRNYQEAKALAAKEGKDLFINFTGSDWCHWCKKLDAEVFSHAAFVDKATAHYVFVFMDKPNSPELQKAVVDAKLRDRLMEEFGVQGFPTIVLATADGMPYATTGYQRGGPEAYLKNLDELKGQGETVKQMLADEAHANVDALGKGLKLLAKSSLLGYPGFAALLDAAEKADADGSLGLKEIVEAERNRQLSAAEEQEVRKLLPKQRGETPEWEKIIPALKQTKHMNGFMFLQLAFASADWLIGQDRAQEAKDLLTFAKRDKLVQEHARAKEVWGQLMEKAEKKLHPEESTDDVKPEEGDGGGGK